jgi:hypothetical protein
MTIVRVKSTEKLLRVWSDNTDEQTYTCIDVDGDIEYSIPCDYGYDEVEVLPTQDSPFEVPPYQLDRIFPVVVNDLAGMIPLLPEVSPDVGGVEISEVMFSRLYSMIKKSCIKTSHTVFGDKYDSRFAGGYHIGHSVDTFSIPESVQVPLTEKSTYACCMETVEIDPTCRVIKVLTIG